MNLLDRVAQWWRSRSREERGGGGDGYMTPGAFSAGKPMQMAEDWFPPLAGPNLINEQYLDLARRRIRDLVDNNPHLDGACKTITNNVVHCGIWPIPNTRWRELNKRIKELFWAVAEAVDAGREKSIAESQRSFVHENFGGGECLCYRPIAGPWRHWKAGPAIELIEAERLELHLTGRTRAGTRVRHAVEFDGDGRRTAYHVLREHPADGGLFGGGFGLGGVIGAAGYLRIPAEDANLAFIERRNKQIRGVPWPVSVAAVTKLEAAFDEATVLLGYAAACVALSMEGGDPKWFENATNWGVADGATGKPPKRFRPGSILFRPVGRAKPELLAPNVPGPTFNTAVQVLLRRMAAGLGISYASLARDYSQATFSATRAESLEDRKGYQPLQEFVWTGHTGPFYRRLIDWWIVTGQLALTPEQERAFILDPQELYRCNVQMPGWEWVNPHQEAQADKLALETGMKSGPEICRSRGRHHEDVIDEQVAFEVYERDARKAAGLESRAKPAVAVAAPQQDKDEEEEKERKEAETRARLERLELLGLGGANGHVNGVHGHA